MKYFVIDWYDDDDGEFLYYGDSKEKALTCSIVMNFSGICLICGNLLRQRSRQEKILEMKTKSKKGRLL